MGGKIGKTEKQRIDKAVKLSSMIKDVLLADGRKEHGLKVEVCGSVRRKREYVGDIDIAVNWSLADLVTILQDWGEKDSHDVVLMSDLKRAKKVVNLVIDEVQIDLYFARDDQWGAMLLFLTGSRLFNIVFRGKARKLGYKLNQYGLYHGDEVIAGKTEEQIFYALGIDYIAPEERSLTYKHIKKIEQKGEMLWKES